MTTETELRELSETVADGQAATIGVLDEGLRGTQSGLQAVAEATTAGHELVAKEIAAGREATSGIGALLRVVTETVEGLKGKDGVDGAEGPAGAGGPAGPVGADGKDGADGRDGTNGIDGKDGANGTNGRDGADGLKGDKGLNWRGPFDGRVTYRPDDAVEFQGSSFVAVDPIRGVAPPDNGWELLARRGAQGPSGSGGGGGGVALSNAVPLVESGTGVPGTGTKASRHDHVHPSDGGGGGGADDQTAAEVPFTPADDLSSTNVQDAIQEAAADTQIALNLHRNETSEAHAASAVGFTPAGGIAATDVQAAIEELDTEKAALASAVMDGDAAGGDLSGTYPNPSVVNDSHSHGPGTAPGSGTGFDYVQEADPGAVGAGKFWLFAGTFGYPDTYQLRRRNAGNTAWLPVTAIYTETSEGTYINSPDNGSFLQLGLSGQFTELGNSDGTNLFLDQGGIFHGSPNGEGWYHGSVDPSAGAGVVAVRGSFYQLNDGASAGSLWVKSGNADTAWTKLGAGLAGSAQTYTESNVTTDRALNANSATLDEIADVLGTLIVDLRNRGVVA